MMERIFIRARARARVETAADLARRVRIFGMEMPKRCPALSDWNWGYSPKGPDNEDLPEWRQVRLDYHNERDVLDYVHRRAEVDERGRLASMSSAGASGPALHLNGTDRSAIVNIRGGNTVWSHPFANMATVETRDFMPGEADIPDSDMIVGAIGVLSDCFEAECCDVYTASQMEAWTVRTSSPPTLTFPRPPLPPLRLFWPSWMNWLAPWLAERVVPPDGALVTRYEDGSILIRTCAELDDVMKPEAVEVGRAVGRALNKLQPPDADRIYRAEDWAAGPPF